MISDKVKYEIYKPKKFLGQNFLVDENIAKKIVSSLEVSHGDIVIEIGPGKGVLTKYLSMLTSNLIAVEIDKSIYTELKEKYNEKIKLIHGDFLKLNFEKNIINTFSHRNKIKIIGNIPYNITSEILFKLYESKDKIDLAVLMMQKEVAHRLIAKPNVKSYGILAIQTQVHTIPKILFNVPPTAFFPKPKVNSCVMKLDFDKTSCSIEDKNLFKMLVREAFGKRRKTMKNSLKFFFEENNIRFEDIKFDFSRRPENVSVEEFINLANSIKQLTV